MDRENVFEKQSQKILAYLKSHLRYDENFLPRPFFLEFVGSPSSGKTTTIKEVGKFLKRRGLRVWRPQEGAEAIMHIERTTPLYNIRTGIYALTMLIDNSVGHLYDVVIFDRGIFDAYCWMEYWQEKGKLSWTEKKLIQQAFLFRLWRNKIDAAYFMVCEPEKALKRELRIAVSQELGETTNPATMKNLVRYCKSAYETLSPTNPQLHLVDTTNINEKTMVDMIVPEILNIFEKKAEERDCNE